APCVTLTVPTVPVPPNPLKPSVPPPVVGELIVTALFGQFASTTKIPLFKFIAPLKPDEDARSNAPRPFLVIAPEPEIKPTPKLPSPSIVNPLAGTERIAN